MSTFFSELRRRKVYRVAAGYGVVAWLLIQVAATVFPAWELPAWSLRLVIALVLIGFPIALILAWAFDFTNEGIRPDRESTASTAIPSEGLRRRSNVFLLGGFGVVVAAVAAFFLLPRAAADRIDKSIAVLPFENLSESKDNAFFADGIQDDVLTNLSKIGDLKVISRTSVMGYRGQRSTIREIAKTLGVGAILEGSVRRDGNRVRVNVQLINGETDEHIWSEIYDRDLTDIFAIQTDLAQKIAQELQAKLSPSEKVQMTRKPTENGEAYLAFIQAHNLHVHVEDVEKLRQAEQLYERALTLDPNFAAAAAASSRLQSWIYRTSDPDPARAGKARALAERALKLQPDCAEGHLALGYSYYYGDRDYAKALREFGMAQAGLPNDAGVHLALGAIQRRQGKWKESTANLEKAAALSPNDSWTLQNLAHNYGLLREYDKANQCIDRALKVSPESPGLWSIKGQLEIQEKGTFEVTELGWQFLAETSPPAETRAYITIGLVQVRLLQRKYAEALREAEGTRDELLARHPGKLQTKHVVIGIARKLLGDEAGARTALLLARSMAEKSVAEAPDDADRISALAGILVWLGEKEAAIAQAQRAAELLPESVDAFDGPMITQSLAEVYALAGEEEKAIDLIDGLLSRPSNLSVAMLKVIPIWDPLRDNPRFGEVLRKHGASI